MAYLDANVFIFAAVVGEAADPKAVQSKQILQKIADGLILASTSILTWDEIIWGCKASMPLKEAVGKGEIILTLPNLSARDATALIVKKAGELAIECPLRPRDAIHAATAILHGEKEIITDDADFDKVRELKRVTLTEASR
ncbi:type II toxin-antitoxin system VapC family toxin [Candidatus Woesearchaeota archaeon]|nr:type II toxin-antitoxin system VapC family toxin [Candidatus Woesearchaeota archaeon]